MAKSLTHVASTRRTIAACAAAVAACVIFSADPSGSIFAENRQNYFDMDLEQLLQVRIATAAAMDKPIARTPAADHTTMKAVEVQGKKSREEGADNERRSEPEKSRQEDS